MSLNLELNPYYFIKKKLNDKTTRNFSNNTDYSETENLENLTIKQLREIAKKHKINLKGKRLKKDIQNIIKAFFIAKNRPSSVEIVNPNFTILSDGNGRINISPWFREIRHESGFNPLARFLNSRDVARMKNKLREKQNLEDHEIIRETETGVFVAPHIALIAASFLNDDLFHDIYHFYLVSKPAEIKLRNKNRIREEAFSILKELDFKLNQHVRWDTFDIPFAFYMIQIDNVVKAGRVGKNEEPKKENLDSRLSSHRSTYARFKLVNVFEFRDSQTVKLFEDMTKHLLSPYTIGRDIDLNLEQYECVGKDTGQFINNLVLQQFKSMNLESRQLAMECPKEEIDNYNKTSAKRTGSFLKDGFEKTQ